jgi:glycosyltransferase involved in cell wall biosynthesis
MSQKIKVGLMTYSFDGRKAKGSALYARTITEQFLRNPNLDCTLIHFEKSDDPIYSQAKEELIIPSGIKSRSRFISLLAYFLRKRNDKYDIVHWFQPRAYPFFWLAPARKIVFTVHGAGDITSGGEMVFSRRMFNWVLKTFNRKAHAHIAVSEFGRQEVIEHYGTNPDDTYAVYNGGGEVYKALEKDAARTRVNDVLNFTGHYILNVSRLQPHKNVEALVKAYIQLRERNDGVDAKLLVVAWPTFDYERTYEAARSSRFSTDIVFVDYVDASLMNDLYSGAEFFVFPSLNEGFGLPVIDAMSAGTAVIVSSSASLPEIAGDAGMVVEPDAESIARGMEAMWSDSALRAGYVQKGLVRAQYFTWEKCAAETVEIYSRILNK